jgi:hypothetical protein
VLWFCLPVAGAYESCCCLHDTSSAVACQKLFGVSGVDRGLVRSRRLRPSAAGAQLLKHVIPMFILQALVGSGCFRVLIVGWTFAPYALGVANFRRKDTVFLDEDDDAWQDGLPYTSSDRVIVNGSFSPSLDAHNDVSEPMNEATHADMVDEERGRFGVQQRYKIGSREI